MMATASVEPIQTELLRLLEVHHGVGIRDGVPGWLGARLDRAVARIATETGLRTEDVLALLRREPARLAEVADAVRVGETSFCRDRDQWLALNKTILDANWTGPTVRAISVGCSTGEEVWTCAMLLDEITRSREQRYRVVGMDRSREAIAVAERGEYPYAAVSKLPESWTKRYLRRNAELAIVGEPLKSNVNFVTRDLTRGLPAGQYELIICKNVLIYLGHDAQRQAALALRQAMAPQSILMVARSEVPILRQLGSPIRELAPGISVVQTP